MISGRLQIFAVIAVVLFFMVLIWLLKQNRFALKYSILWMFSGVVMLLLALFPGLLDGFARLIGVYSAVNALFAVLIFCGMALMISLTSILSKEKQEIVRLVQQTAILEKRVRELEAKLNTEEIEGRDPSELTAEAGKKDGEGRTGV